MFRRRECKICGKGWYINNPVLTGKVINRKITEGYLPGLPGPIKIRISTVQCTKCGRKWHYRQKAQ